MRRPRVSSWRTATATATASLVLLVVGGSLVPTAAAAMPPSAVAPAAAVESLLRDVRVPVQQDGQWVYAHDEARALHKREDDIDTASSETTTRPTKTTTTEKTATTHKTTTTTAATTATAATTTTTATGTAATTSTHKTTTTATASKTAASSPLPSIFDSSLGSNFSTGTACPQFINSFLTNDTFKSCYPFSLLFQNSRSFFNAEKSLVAVTQVLDATCAANSTLCTAYLSSLATELVDAANCGADYQLGNSVVVQAYQGMVAYQPLYSATCLKDRDTSAYCYANAITNLTTTANVYFYYLPYNISLPANTSPSCNYCLQQTMALFRSAAANRSLPIASTYVSAAQQVDAVCGAGFVNDALPAPTTSAAGPSLLRQAPSVLWLAPSLLLGVGAHLLL